MHYHVHPDDPSPPPAYCWEHLPKDVGTYQCDGNHACVICEEAHEPQLNLDAWFEHIATCKGC